MENSEIIEIHWRIYRDDYIAFRRWMADNHISLIKDGFHNLYEIKINQPSKKIVIS